MADLHALVDALPHIAWLVEPSGRFTVNAHWSAYTGVEAKGLGDCLACLHPDDLIAAETMLRRIDQGEFFGGDVRIRRADGAYRWNRIRGVPFRRGPDDGWTWLGSAVEVHDQRTREQTLRLMLRVVDEARSLDDPREIVEIALRELVLSLGFDRCAYGEVAEDANAFTIFGQFPVAEVGLTGLLDDYGAPIATSLREGTTVVVSDAIGDTPQGVYAHFEARGSRAIICAPIVKGGRLRAYLTVHSSTARNWSGDEVEAVRLVADRSWNEVERVRAEARATEREIRLRALVEANPVGVVVVDIPSGYALEANDAWLKALGRTREELDAGRIDIRAMSGEEGTAITDARIKAVRSGGSVGFYEKDYFKPDGTRVPVLVGFTPLDPGVLRATAFMVDLTELRRAEQAVEEGERRYRILAETIPAIAFTLLPGGEVEYVNRRGEEFFGAGLAQTALEGLGQSIGQGESFEVERPFLRHDREYRWHLCRAVPMRGEDGEINRWIGTLTDIHEAKGRERALRFLVDLDDATAVLDDPAQAMRETNFMLAGAVNADRCSYAEVEGEEFTILGDFARRGPSIVGRWPLAAFGAYYAGQMKDGKTYVVDDVGALDLPNAVREAYDATSIAAVVCAPIVRGGRLVAMMAVHQNRARTWSPEEIALVEQVTERSWTTIERVRARRAVRDANDTLERKVAERTADLKASNDALQGFGYHVSHDLRTPLRAIVSTSRMLQADYEDVLPEEANALLSRQAEAARKLGELIDDLLQLSRLSSAELVKSPVDLTSLARDAALEALSAHPESSVEIEVAEGLTAQADPRLLRLALVNLLENAVKYSPRGGTVRVAQREDGALAFVDKGIGMEPQYLERIFEPFQRLHRDEEYRGTGIGLANVRRVVERHNGRVWAESEPGKGSTFLMTL